MGTRPRPDASSGSTGTNSATGSRSSVSRRKGRPRSSRFARVSPGDTRMRTFAIIAGLAVAGCAYSVSPTGKLAHHTIAIPMFVNESLEYGLDQKATNAVQKAFLDDNRLKVVNTAEAETVLRGTIKKYARGALTFNEREQVQEYKVGITLDLDYVEISSGKSIWHEPGFYVWASYAPGAAETSASGDSLVTAEDEEGAKTLALAKAAREVVARTIEGW